VRYRRLGETDLMVSEVGLDVRPLEGVDEAIAIETLRAAILSGITVFTWDVSDAATDIEPLVARAAGVDRGRLTAVALLDHVPEPEAIGPQIEAIASRLADGEGGEGRVEIMAFPGDLEAAQMAAFEDAQARGIVGFGARSAGSQIQVGGGVITFVADAADALVALGAHDAICAVVTATSPDDLQGILDLVAWG
jgi:hypothetical protein